VNRKEKRARKKAKIQDVVKVDLFDGKAVTDGSEANPTLEEYNKMN
jgi:hypothetical protein